MRELSDQELDDRLRTALGSPPVADFDGWRDRHVDAVAFLNPVVTAAYRRRHKFLLRLVSAAAAMATILAGAIWLFSSQTQSFAQTIRTINNAETITWTITWYTRMYSEDGKRTWLRKEPRWERSYLAPSRWRDVKYDPEGRVSSVEIEDTASQSVLRLDMKKKEAQLKREPSGQFGPGNPFDGIARMLKQESVEFVGLREVDGVQVNVFRCCRDLMQGMHECTEIWLDVESKKLVGYCITPGKTYFDPETAPDRDNPPEKRMSKGTIAGVIDAEIVFDSQLDPALFSLVPPAGFTIVEPKPRPKITEAELIEWLRITARVNGGVFVGSPSGLSREQQVAIADKRRSEQTEIERRYSNIAQAHISDGNYLPIRAFADNSTEPHSFRYLGKEVKLGSADRIVCFYRLPGRKTYRAIYGDLTIKDVDPKDLPLPVDGP